MSHNIFMMVFTMNGFESIVDMTAVQEQNVLDKLADAPSKTTINSILNVASLRARFNQEIRMEVWLLKVSEDLTKDIFEDMAKDSPQELANLLRENGTCVFGHRNNTKCVIT